MFGDSMQITSTKSLRFDMHFLAIKRVETRLFTVFLLYQDGKSLFFYSSKPVVRPKIAAHFPKFPYSCFIRSHKAIDVDSFAQFKFIFEYKTVVSSPSSIRFDYIRVMCVCVCVANAEYMCWLSQNDT